jgi:thiamine-phosphate pyrophosphorylase
VVTAAAGRAAVVVNDRADVARLCGASAVHVGQDDLSPADARAIVGPGVAIGFSTHTLEQVQAALREPVDYIAVGPIFGTRTKDTGYEAVGLDLVRAAARCAGGIPVVAIGGITLENARSVLDAGASAVAVISDLLVGNDPRGRIAAYLGALA